MRSISTLALAGVLLSFIMAGCGRQARVPSPRSSSTRRPPSTTSPIPSTVPDTTARIPKPDVPPGVIGARSDGGPTLRIGLSTAAREVRISSDSEFFLVEKAPESRRQTVRGEVFVRMESAQEPASDVYRIQVGSFSKPETAADLKRRLSERFSLPVIERESADSGTTQVRIGEFPTREEAQRFAKGPLAKAGYRSGFVVRDLKAQASGEPRMTARGSAGLFRTSRAGYFFVAASRSDFLRFDGKAYRGILDLTMNSSGRLTVVNQIEMEDYLQGVVPGEMPPRTYPEQAVLSVQAIAARTYALKNLGRFRAEGFDLTADERSQIYGGVSLEHEATNRAIAATRGQAIYYQGSLINAMYSSTCGGKTEDFAKVFDGQRVPYLTSVFCTFEGSDADGADSTFSGSHELEHTLSAHDGSIANRNLELAWVLGLGDKDDLSVAALDSTIKSKEARAWIARSCTILRKTVHGEISKSSDLISRAGFIREAAKAIFGVQEIQSRISPGDSSYYVGNLRDGDHVPESARASLAYVLQRGLWRPFPDNSMRPAEPIRRIDALCLLARWIEASDPEILRAGIFSPASGSLAGTASGSIAVKWNNRSLVLPLDKKVRLFRLDAAQSTPASTLKLIGGEKLRYHFNASGKVDFLEVELNSGGRASDRFSPQASWRTRLSRRIVSEKLRSLAGSIGEVLDLEPAQHGDSGRVVRMRVEGTRGSTVLNGYRVRNALGLKDTLLKITRTRDSNGLVEDFVFDGRGWGHGVGLCQTGAAGMARAGRSFEGIIKTYYPGVEIRGAY